jgi:hypothetical protein
MPYAMNNYTEAKAGFWKIFCVGASWYSTSGKHHESGTWELTICISQSAPRHHEAATASLTTPIKRR